jgi:hypothetical protein
LDSQRAENFFTDPTVYRTIGECTDSDWTGSGSHHLNWQQQVEINMSVTDNGTVRNFTRTDSTTEPEALQEENEKPAEEDDRSFRLITKESHKVADVDSQTTVGSFSLRKTQMNLQTEVDGKMIEELGIISPLTMEIH